MPDIDGVFIRSDGTFNGPTVWTQEKNAAQLVTAAHFDTHDQDMANALNNRVFADGTTTGVISLNLTATVNSATGVITIGGVNFANMIIGSAGGGAGNLFLGNAGNFSLTGASNIGIGYGLTNIPFAGGQPLTSLTSGVANIGIGPGALLSATTTSGSVAIGNRAGITVSFRWQRQCCIRAGCRTCCYHRRQQYADRNKCRFVNYDRSQ